MSLKLYRQRAADLNAEILKAKKARAAIGDAAVTEKRALTDAERTAFVAGGQEIARLEASLEDNAPLLAAAEEANEAERTYRAPATTEAAAVTTTPHIEVPDMTKRGGYFGRQLQAVRKAAFVLKGGDEQLTAMDRELLKPMQAVGPTGLNSDVPSEGGFLVAQERSSTILQRAYQTGTVLSRVNRMPIGPNSNGILLPAIDETSRADNSRFGGIVSGWLGQGLTLTAGKPKFRLMDLKLKKVGAFVYSTDELIADAVALEAWIGKYLPLELTFRTEDGVFNGTGGNQLQGILNSGAVITVTRSSAGQVIADDMRAMIARMWAPLRANAVFFVNQTVEPELSVLNIAVGTGGVLDPNYRPAGSAPGQIYATYMGIPIIPVEYCAALGTSGDIVLVNLDEYTMIDKGGVDQAVSLHVAFLTDEAVWRFMYRVDGQCSWNLPLTPKAGSTLSCVVVLS